MIKDGKLEIKITNDLDLNVVARELTDLGCVLPINWKRLSTSFSYLGMDFKICYSNGQWALNKYRKYATFSKSWNSDDKFSIEGTLIIDFKALGLAIFEMREGIPGKKADVNAAIFKKEMTATFISAKLNEKFGDIVPVRINNLSKHKTSVTFMRDSVMYETILNITDVQRFINTDIENLIVQILINSKIISTFTITEFLEDLDNIHNLVLHKIGVKIKMETRCNKYREIRKILLSKVEDMDMNIRKLSNQISSMNISNISFGLDFKKDLEIFKCL